MLEKPIKIVLTFVFVPLTRKQEDVRDLFFRFTTHAFPETFIYGQAKTKIMLQKYNQRFKEISENERSMLPFDLVKLEKDNKMFVAQLRGVLAYQAYINGKSNFLFASENFEHNIIHLHKNCGYIWPDNISSKQSLENIKKQYQKIGGDISRMNFTKCAEFDYFTFEGGMDLLPKEVGGLSFILTIDDEESYKNFLNIWPETAKQLAGENENFFDMDLPKKIILPNGDVFLTAGRHGCAHLGFSEFKLSFIDTISNYCVNFPLTSAYTQLLTGAYVQWYNSPAK